MDRLARHPSLNDSDRDHYEHDAREDGAPGGTARALLIGAPNVGDSALIQTNR
jgi:hypothetical protein